MLVENRFAADHARCIPCAREVEDLSRRTFRITRDACRAGFEHTEITHAPLRRVAAYQHDAVAVLDSLAREKSRHARRQLAQIRIRVLFLTPIALDAHRDPRRMTLGC